MRRSCGRVLEPLGVVKKLRPSKVERLCMLKGTTIANNLNAKQGVRQQR